MLILGRQFASLNWINLIDSLKNEYGVLFDDILAGIYSGIVMILLSKWI